MQRKEDASIRIVIGRAGQSRVGLTQNRAVKIWTAPVWKRAKIFPWNDSKEIAFLQFFLAVLDHELAHWAQDAHDFRVEGYNELDFVGYENVAHAFGRAGYWARRESSACA